MPSQSTFKNMLLSLFLVCLLSSAVLGWVYALTLEPIEKAKVASENAAVAQVVPEFDNEPSAEAFEEEVDGKIYKVYPVKKSGEPVAYAIRSTTSKGFGGNVTVMVGFLMDGSIYNSIVVSHAETPGLGDKMHPSKSDFPEQFKSKNPADFKLSVKKDGGDVDAITAATVSSRAYCDAIGLAYNVFLAVTGASSDTDAYSGASVSGHNE